MSELDGKFATSIRKRLRARFWKEKAKGALINDLLEQHYKNKV